LPERAVAEPDRPGGRSRARWRWGATGLGLVALAVSLSLWDPQAAPGPTFCLFKRLTGLACPGCGLTRAAALAAHGRWRDSLAAHPLLPVLAAAAAAAWLLWGERVWTGRRRLVPAHSALAVALAAALVVVWLVRWLAGTLPP